jgi:hypothetical protein
MNYSNDIDKKFINSVGEGYLSKEEYVSHVTVPVIKIISRKSSIESKEAHMLKLKISVPAPKKIVKKPRNDNPFQESYNYEDLLNDCTY